MKWQKTTPYQLIPIALASALLAGQSVAADTPARKREGQLMRRLAKSDAQTAALQKRIAELENRVKALTAALVLPEQPAAAKPVQTATVAQTAPVAPAAVPPVSSSPEGTHTATARPAPGKFDVDEDAAQRALERTLTQSGALLLPRGTVELTPGFTYKRTELTSPQFATATNSATGAPDLVLVNQHARRNEMTASLDLRAGLPYNSQVELSLPFNYVRSSQVNDIGTSTSDNGKGMGDITVGLANAFVRESGWHPDLIGRLSYNFGNGRRNDGLVSLGAGFRQVQAELVALKRQDPLAFVASTFYQKTYEKDGIKPGNAAGLSLSALLAASPATSLQFGFSQIYRQKQEINGAELAGSDQTYGIFTLGASSVLSRDVTLITRFGIGVGNDAPKYSFNFSLPILFR